MSHKILKTIMNCGLMLTLFLGTIACEKDLEDIVQRVLGNQEEAKRLQDQLVSQKLLNFYKEKITFKVKKVNYEQFVKEVYK